MCASFERSNLFANVLRNLSLNIEEMTKQMKYFRHSRKVGISMNHHLIKDVDELKV